MWNWFMFILNSPSVWCFENLFWLSYHIGQEYRKNLLWIIFRSFLFLLCTSVVQFNILYLCFLSHDLITLCCCINSNFFFSLFVALNVLLVSVIVYTCSTISELEILWWVVRMSSFFYLLPCLLYVLCLMEVEVPLGLGQYMYWMLQISER
jgi:hypothetical protein